MEERRKRREEKRQVEIKCSVPRLHSLQSRTMRQFANPPLQDKRFPVEANMHLSGNFQRVCHFHPGAALSEMSEVERTETETDRQM